MSRSHGARSQMGLGSCSELDAFLAQFDFPTYKSLVPMSGTNRCLLYSVAPVQHNAPVQARFLEAADEATFLATFAPKHTLSNPTWTAFPIGVTPLTPKNQLFFVNLTQWYNERVGRVVIYEGGRCLGAQPKEHSATITTYLELSRNLLVQVCIHNELTESVVGAMLNTMGQLLSFVDPAKNPTGTDWSILMRKFLTGFATSGTTADVVEQILATLALGLAPTRDQSRSWVALATKRAVKYGGGKLSDQFTLGLVMAFKSLPLVIQTVRDLLLRPHEGAAKLRALIDGLLITKADQLGLIKRLADTPAPCAAALNAILAESPLTAGFEIPVDALIAHYSNPATKKTLFKAWGDREVALQFGPLGLGSDGETIPDLKIHPSGLGFDWMSTEPSMWAMSTFAGRDLLPFLKANRGFLLRGQATPIGISSQKAGNTVGADKGGKDSTINVVLGKGRSITNYKTERVSLATGMRFPKHHEPVPQADFTKPFYVLVNPSTGEVSLFYTKLGSTDSVSIKNLFSLTEENELFIAGKWVKMTFDMIPFSECDHLEARLTALASSGGAASAVAASASAAQGGAGGPPPTAVTPPPTAVTPPPPSGGGAKSPSATPVSESKSPSPSGGDSKSPAFDAVLVELFAKHSVSEDAQAKLLEAEMTTAALVKLLTSDLMDKLNLKMGAKIILEKRVIPALP